MSDGSDYGAQQKPSGSYGSTGGSGSYGNSQNAPSPYGQSKATQPPKRNKAYWLKAAIAEFITYKTHVPNQINPFDAKAYNVQVTASYARMYLTNPAAFKWAGMAAFASAGVGEGMQTSYNLAWGAGAQTFTPAALWIGGLLLDRDTSARAGELLFWALSGGNRLVWADIFWQHVAYRDGGFQALKDVKAAGELTDRVFNGWTLIDTGLRAKDQNKIWDGNAALLKYEQEVFLQKHIYDRSEVKGLWKNISGDIPSPIPGHGVDFIDHVPGGNIGVFADRWKWIEESMLPAWKSLETSDPGRTKTLIEGLI
jgi:hypothetical protein